jgi:quinol monooxygenase YgiN
MIRVLATIQATEGRRDDLLAEFKKIIPAVHAEDGCLEYAVWVDLPNNLTEERKDVVVCVEKWESLEKLEAHLIAPHMVEFRTATEGLRQGVELEILEEA